MRADLFDSVAMHRNTKVFLLHCRFSCLYLESSASKSGDFSGHLMRNATLNTSFLAVMLDGSSIDPQYVRYAGFL
jgi:hypothetical protein